MYETSRMHFKRIEITKILKTRCKGSAYMKDTPYKWQNKKDSLPDIQWALPSEDTG